MKYIRILLFFAFVSNAQIQKEQLNLMPWPQNINLTTGTFALSKKFKVNITGNPNPRIFIGATNFLRRLDGRTGLFLEQSFLTKVNESPEAELQINCVRNGKIEINEDESYKLTITSNKITINATSDLGALHGLETLLQLLQNNSTSYYFPTVEITDSPRFTWRGLMIDGARHFQPVDVIKRNLDAMASMKMNVFHWHLADDQGWRIEMKKHPKLTELASDGSYYTQEEIRNIVKYADERGILVIPEIDVPGHASAFLTAYPEVGSKVSDGKVTYEVQRNSGIFNATLDPSNPKTYQLLSEIFDAVCPLFPGAYFHIGGDENNGKEWNANPKIQEFKKKYNLANNHDLQTYFNMQLIPMLKKHNKRLMGWEEIMTENMSKDAIIHAWRGTNEGLSSGGSLIKAAKSGFKTVLSNGYYIDLMLGVEKHYLNDPIPKNSILTPEEKTRILGGEAAMWSELVTPLNIDSRIWPRTAAIAERLWSNEDVTDLNSLHKRLKMISFRLEELGITHLRNKEVILRNISNNQKTAALNDFSNVCEPLKIYTRNGGGKKYRMHSPLTLFADACTADALDVFDFDTAVNNYLENKSQENQILVTNFFKKWITMNSDLIGLSSNAPLVQPLLPLSKSLSDLSQQLLLVIEKKQTANPIILNDLLEQCNSKKNADVELAVYNSLKKLL
ncbi:beta-N-acetylhexosaminidase [Flavobacterium gawalongense]|uniref:Family 20 glycosylhydrolase n=1 Tax=Flavobacterium gawalongense TaxID=2594432 RepID=A0A553BAM3_9FLAO|nr:family 20 glycosylhydrolase [Flavobacterium gawalongense]TRW97930.1 family 20 glycosylhydrolase [Flavobacterium gawalongense]TRX02294.1 family 20 glycosylhydrolase [Flavobacterium gawalongense]TRX05298.1 family 20 glycosylhydrolase [Flavobacterium gawalongense]TRX06163.1 family 20 glycosylhydrolase [Flavobacterium gawalongense]TRX21873.1 family 20 glycosylhydrolase [Flavobacterium gawalongense]